MPTEPTEPLFIHMHYSGTHGDSVTMASQFKECSFGKLQFTTNYEGQINTSVLKDDGVLEVTLSKRLDQMKQSEMRNEVMAEARKKLGFTLPGNLDHVMVVVERCYRVDGEGCNFAAYAYINHW